MSLPIVIIFERHWDEIPKHLVRDLLPELAEKGYDTFCIEAPQDWSSSQIIAAQDSSVNFTSEQLVQSEKFLKQVELTEKLSSMSFSTLAELLRQKVSSQHSAFLAERFKCLPAERLQVQVFAEVNKLSLRLKGIDVIAAEYKGLNQSDFAKRDEYIEAKETPRIETIVGNLLKLKQVSKGIVFGCGTRHAVNLIRRLRELNSQDHLLYYFPHSCKRFDHRVDDTQWLADNDVLRDHTYALSKKGVRAFKDRIVTEVASKTVSQVEVAGECSHTEILKRTFGVAFKIYMQPDFFANAVVDVKDVPDLAVMKERLHAVGIQTRETSLEGRVFLVIPNVNTKPVATNLCLFV